MTILFAAFILLSFSGCKIAEPGDFHRDYMSVRKTNAVKGFFVMLVFFSHLSSYTGLNGQYDSGYKIIRYYLAQLIVTMFLFYSGYGIMESIRKKGTPYIKKIPLNRVLRVLLHFDIAVVMFAVLNILIGRDMPAKKLLLSFIGWESIGNSNWYILMMIIAYLATFLGFILFRKNRFLGAAATTAILVGTVFIMLRYRPMYYCNTLLCYPLGIWYSLFREKLEKLFMRNDLLWICSLGAAMIPFALCFFRRYEEFWMYQGWAVSFTAIAVLITMKLSIDNGFLQFFGNHVFSIYILQRLPMLFMAKYFNCSLHPVIFFGISLAVTSALAIVFDYAMAKLDKAIFQRRTTP